MKALRFWKNHPSGLPAGFVLVAAALLVVSLFVGCRASYSHESTAAIPARSGLHAPGARARSGISPDSLAGPAEELWVITRSISDNGQGDPNTLGSGALEDANERALTLDRRGHRINKVYALTPRAYVG